MDTGHDSRAIANEIIRIGNEKDIAITMMKLIKLVFFAHGWKLGLTGQPLAKDPVEAWQYGPVFRRLYNDLPYQGAAVITKTINDENGQPFVSDFSPVNKRIMERVVDVYGSMGAFQLSDLTHELDTPWDITVKTRGFYSAIENSLIQKYFQELGDKNAGNSSKHL